MDLSEASLIRPIDLRIKHKLTIFIVLGQIDMIGQIFVVVIGVVLWEHFGRIFNFWKPSRPLTFLAEQAIKTWDWLGAWAAKLSSYLIHLKLDELWPSIRDLAKPCLELLFSWWHFFGSYVKVAATYSTPIMVFIGSVVALVVMIWGLERWNSRPYRWIKSIVQPRVGIVVNIAVLIVIAAFLVKLFILC